MKCAACGKPVEAGWIRCPFCGQDLAAAQPPAGAAPPSSVEQFRQEVAAAVADGFVDENERKRLLAAVKSLGLQPEDAARIMREEREKASARSPRGAGLAAAKPEAASEEPAELSDQDKLSRLEAMKESGKISEATYAELRAKLLAKIAPQAAPEKPARKGRKKAPPTEPPAEPTVVQGGGGVKVADSVIKGNITSTTININAAAAAQGGRHRLIVCPICGKKNEEDQTASCPACRREGLCPSHLGSQGACEDCVEKTLAAHALHRPKPPLPDISADLPYQNYLRQNLSSAWYAGLAGGDAHCVKGPLPVTPPGLIHECRRLSVDREFRVDMLSYWLTACPMIQARFRTCMVALEQWAFHYPELRGEFFNLWMANADVIGMQADATYFDRPDVRARHGAV